MSVQLPSSSFVVSTTSFMVDPSAVAAFLLFVTALAAATSFLDGSSSFSTTTLALLFRATLAPLLPSFPSIFANALRFLTALPPFLLFVGDDNNAFFFFPPRFAFSAFFLFPPPPLLLLPVVFCSPPKVPTFILTSLLLPRLPLFKSTCAFTYVNSTAKSRPPSTYLTSTPVGTEEYSSWWTLMMVACPPGLLMPAHVRDSTSTS
mmetsp:Transcript_22749/g.47470  ORF Transcript_22749/g.47470 Transcript_22749/m.47470 type:complete len:205 (+) Transcript_22749:667-1281(+)